MAQDTRLVLLGTGTPNAEPNRSGPSVAIVSGDNAFVIDLGPGVVRRAVAAWQAGVAALEPSRLRHAFVTHLHSDHTAGLADFLLTPWVLGRAETVQVYGPPGVKAMTEHVLAAYEQDIEQRRKGLEPANDSGWTAAVHEVKTGVVYQDAGLTVEALPVEHGSWQAFGYRFRAKDRTIVISGDTAPTDTIIKAATGCDILLHEVYSAVGFATLSRSWQEYHSKVHTSAEELGRIASEARPKLLVLYHQLRWGVSENDLVAEIGRVYDGPVSSGRDLEIY
ncbi:MBL fold metallo-hydrolase [Candidatus Eisenbacteria bacterium]|uniref:MBL fold metallo-hydrolase n=1 Tax=Eiseniibacteriota bacterium TaxID=2212470 RepID=A0ABV6YJP2_UNCEI